MQFFSQLVLLFFHLVMFSPWGLRDGPFVPSSRPNILVSAGRAVAGDCGMVARGQRSSRGVGCVGDVGVRSRGQVCCCASSVCWNRVTSSYTPRRPPWLRSALVTADGPCGHCTKRRLPCERRVALTGVRVEDCALHSLRIEGATHLSTGKATSEVLQRELCEPGERREKL